MSRYQERLPIFEWLLEGAYSTAQPRLGCIGLLLDLKCIDDVVDKSANSWHLGQIGMSKVFKTLFLALIRANNVFNS